MVASSSSEDEESAFDGSDASDDEGSGSDFDDDSEGKFPVFSFPSILY